VAAGTSVSKNIGLQDLATSSRLQADSMTLQIGGHVASMASNETSQSRQKQAKTKKSGLILGSAAFKSSTNVTDFEK
jgi:hypothetical protein